MDAFGEPDSGVFYVPRPAAYAVILDDKHQVACVNEESGLFLPGGGLEPGEDALQAVHREIAEECARALEIVSHLGSAVQYYRTPRGEPRELQATFFLARFEAPLERQAQHVVRWLPARPEPPRFFHECHRWVVREALSARGA